MEIMESSRNESAFVAVHRREEDEEDDDELACLPPGFRFHPTDEEIILHYLKHKVVDNRFVAKAIGEVDLNKCEPWDLPKKAKMGEKVWWFFCQRDRKYPTGTRTNRATESGYWKATGKDKEIFMKGKGNNCLIGMKKTLVFYKGRAPKGEKSNWVMHEYRLEGQFSFNYSHRTTRDEWVVCRIVHKSTGNRGIIPMENDRMEYTFVDNLIHSPSTTTLPALMEFPHDNRPAAAGATSSSAHFLDNNNHDDHYDFKMRPMMSSSSSPYFPMTYNYYKMFHQHNEVQPNSTPGYATNNSNALLYSAFVAGGDGPGDKSVISGNTSKVKVEQCSNNNFSGSTTQETGLSTEVAAAAETTSVVSNVDDDQDRRPFQDLDGEGGLDVLDRYTFWDY